MALIDLARWQAYTGRTVTGEEAVAVSYWAQAVDSVLQRVLWPTLAEPATITQIYDAPPVRDIVLSPRPVRIINWVRFNPQAQGDPLAFDANHTVPPKEYQLVIDDPVTNISRCGVLRRNGKVWGYTWWSPPLSLAVSLRALRGAIQVQYEAGYSEVPPAIVAAAAQAVTLCMQRRRQGVPPNSEGWNGYTVSWSPQALALAAIQHPDVERLLLPYLGVRLS
jgi:hypothetical protein